MKRILFLFFGLLITTQTWCQGWLTNSGSLYSPLSYNSYVGIGIVPQYKLDVNGKVCIRPTDLVSGKYISYLNWMGHILTIGTPLNEYANNYLDFKPGGSTSGALETTFRMYTTSAPNVYEERVHLTSDGNCWFKNTGNFGIGTQTPNYTLDVNGTIRANEIIVNTDGADFVFEEGYNLMSLEQLSAFVESNHHLPEIQSADEMQNEGMGVSELQTKLLQKVEELTLYIILQEKRIQALEAELNK